MDIIYQLINNENYDSLSSIYYFILIFILSSDYLKVNSYNNLFEKHQAINNQYNIFNIDIKPLSNILYQLTQKKQLENIDINRIFRYYFENDTQNNIKEYFKFYNNSLLIKWLVNMTKPNILNDTILDGNIKINSFIEEIINIGNQQNIDYSQYKDNIDGLQMNTFINDISKAILLNKTDCRFNQIYNTDILSNDLPNKKFYDIIFFDFPTNIHNIIHASCCNKIKKLKIRGTKFEPLLLQLIMMSLNKNGKAVCIVPDAFLFSDSLQPIETRKYLINNFKLKKIIQLDETFYYFKNNKTSVLYFENNGKTENIEFTKLNYDLSENHLLTLNTELLKNNLYSLFYKHYQEIPININLEYLAVEEQITINNNFIDKQQNLALDKYYKNDNSIRLTQSSDKNINYYLTGDLFNLKYLELFLKNNYQQFIKGKMKQFDIDKIKNIKLPILTNEKKVEIMNYYQNIQDIILTNQTLINNYLNLKNNLFNLIPINKTIELSQIATITETIDNDLIGINRNGSTAGTITFYENINELSNNLFYLKSSNPKYIYYYLKYYETKLKEIANLNAQPIITKSSLLSIKIPDLDKNNCDSIINLSSFYEKQIDNIMISNQELEKINIFNLISKLY